MDEKPKSFWWNIWGRPQRFFLWLTVLLLIVGVGLQFHTVLARIIHYPGNNVGVGGWKMTPGLFKGLFAYAVTFIFAAVGLALSLIPWTRPAMSWVLRRWFFCAAGLATLLALFYAEEDWRGKRDWEQCKRDMEAKGFEMDWTKHIPEPVADDQNFFKAPSMQKWFVGRGPSEIVNRLASPRTDSISGKTNAIVTEAQARDYLAWSDQFAPEFDLIREALKRPYARMDGDYSHPFNIPVPNFVAARQVARTLAQRAHSYFILQQPDKALEELTLMHDLCRMFQAAPAGKPMTLLAAMINVAVTGLYVDTIGEGFKLRCWREPQLVALQKQLKETHLLPFAIQAFRDEPAASSYTLETLPAAKLMSTFGVGGDISFFSIAPRGWLDQNLVNLTRFSVVPAEGFDAEHESVSPAVCDAAEEQVQTFVSHRSLFRIFAAIAIPNYRKAIMRVAMNQDLADQALVACALERYRIAHSQYPESLDSLVPQFIEKLPHDIIKDGDLKYHKTENSFVLYSIGWNEKDDGGTSVLNKDGSTDLEKGDWVWPHAPK